MRKLPSAGCNKVQLGNRARVILANGAPRTVEHRGMAVSGVRASRKNLHGPKTNYRTPTAQRARAAQTWLTLQETWTIFCMRY